MRAGACWPPRGATFVGLDGFPHIFLAPPETRSDAGRCKRVRTKRDISEWSSASLDGACDAVLLGRLGRELAILYRDTLHSPLPPRLQTLIDRLDQPPVGDHRAPLGERGRTASAI